MADEVPASGNGLGKPETGAHARVAGAAGGFEGDGQELCIHDHPGGKGCYVCDPDHPYKQQEGAEA